MQIVSCQILDDVCVVGSSLNNEIRCLVHAGRDPGRLAWRARWKTSIEMRESIRNSQLIALLRTSGSSVVVIPNDQKHVVPRYEPSFQLGLSPALTARLLWKPSTETPRNFSLGLVDTEAES